jgi:hypothetical protein
MSKLLVVFLAASIACGSAVTCELTDTANGALACSSVKLCSGISGALLYADQHGEEAHLAASDRKHTMGCQKVGAGQEAALHAWQVRNCHADEPACGCLQGRLRSRSSGHDAGATALHSGTDSRHHSMSDQHAASSSMLASLSATRGSGNPTSQLLKQGTGVEQDGSNHTSLLEAGIVGISQILRQLMQQRFRQASIQEVC